MGVGGSDSVALLSIARVPSCPHPTLVASDANLSCQQAGSVLGPGTIWRACSISIRFPGASPPRL